MKKEDSLYKILMFILYSISIILTSVFITLALIAGAEEEIVEKNVNQDLLNCELLNYRLNEDLLYYYEKYHYVENDFTSCLDQLKKYLNEGV